MESSTYFIRLLLLSLVPLARAYTVFETTCSAPDPQSEFMFVSAPNTRGTLNILWTSLFTIFACTWTVQHLNIPKPRNGRGHGKRGQLKWKLRGFGKSFNLMIVNILAPELIMAEAADDLTESYRLKEEMQRYAKQDKVKWTLTHSFYAAMGGFVIRNGSPGKRIFYRLNAREVFQLRHRKQIKSLPDITAEELKDKSKSDVLGKIVAIGQILWTIVQVIARAVQKLPVSPLEIAVVAFAACAIFTYGMYWDKPQRVLTPIDLLDNVQYDEKEKVLTKILEKHQAWIHTHGDRVESDLESDLANRGSHPEYEWRQQYDLKWRRQRNALAITAITAALFGGVHVIAWEFAFPTRIELIWWRCASVYATASPPVMALILGVILALYRPEAKGSDFSKKVGSILLGFFLAPLLCLYIVARLFILVEMFRTLFFLPAGSYISTWSTNIPHVG